MLRQKKTTLKGNVITENIKLNDGFFYSSNGSATLKMFAELKNNSEEFIINMNEAAKILKNLKDKEVDFSIVDDKKVAINERFRVGKIENEDNFYKVLNEVEGEKIQLPSDFMEKYLIALKFASKEEMRVHLLNVRLETGKLIATDAYKLVIIPLNIEMGDKSINIHYLPKKYNYNYLTISEDCESYTFFDETERFSITQKEESKYPNYIAVIPESNDKMAIFSSKIDFKEIINEATTINEHTKQIALTFLNNVCKVESEDVSLGRSYEKKIECEYIGDEIKIGFNGEFLNTIIDNYKGDDFNMKMSQPSRAAIFEDNDKKLFLLMSVMINN